MMTSFENKLMHRLMFGDNESSHEMSSSYAERFDGNRRALPTPTNGNKTITSTSFVSDKNKFQTPQDEQFFHSNEIKDGRTTTMKKPNLVIHLGPPKTATTSLQLDLTRLKEMLALDGYIYAGRYYCPKWNNVQQKTVLDRQEMPMMDILRTMFKPSHCRKNKNDERLVECVQPFQEALEPFKNNNKNIILSDEGYTLALGRPEYYQALQDALSDEWDIILVMGYRRFFEWLPSDMFQRYRMDKVKGDLNWKNHWPGGGGIGGGQESPGEKVTLLFPWYYKGWKEMGHRYSDFVANNVGNNTFPLGILNLHDDQKSVLTQFVCDILPDASRSCAESKKRDELGNVTTTNDAAGVLHVNYDMLTTGAAELGLVDTSRFERKDIRHALKNFTESELGKTHWDFELICPDQSQLDEFLNMSLELETRILGSSVAAAMESKSRTAFWQDVKEHKFCEVDAEATLSKEPWKSYFAQFALHQS